MSNSSLSRTAQHDGALLLPFNNQQAAVNSISFAQLHACPTERTRTGILFYRPFACEFT